MAGARRPKPAIRVFICDDNESVRVTLVRALDYRPGIEVVGEASSAEGLPEAVRSSSPDVIVLDVNLPGISGIEGVRVLRAAGIATPVVVMSADKRSEELADGEDVSGFFYKGTTDLDELVEKIAVAAGRR